MWHVIVNTENLKQCTEGNFLFLLYVIQPFILDLFVHAQTIMIGKSLSSDSMLKIFGKLTDIIRTV